MTRDPEQPRRLHIVALRQLADGPMIYDERWHGFVPGYAVDDGRLAFANSVVLWLGLRGWARVHGHVATITTDGLRALREIEARQAA
jgi:hypothetical protein